jgi:hypothetical protein
LSLDRRLSLAAAPYPYGEGHRANSCAAERRAIASDNRTRRVVDVIPNSFPPPASAW